MIDSHRIAERARILSHRLYAERLEEDPGLLDAARAAIVGVAAAEGATVGEKAWAELLRADFGEIIGRMLDEGEEGRLLRANSPFSLLVGVDDPNVRKALWRQAKAELLGKRTSTARSAA